jgi:glutathione synthase/RimK-type ligase-like ATP-grasp enzyme
MGFRLATAVISHLFNRAEWDDFLRDRAVQKQTVGTNGRRMSIVSPKGSVSPTIENEETYIQEFLDSSGKRPTDVRAYVVDETVVGAMRRHAPEGEWRTNVALGGEVADITRSMSAEQSKSDGRTRRLSHILAGTRSTAPHPV